MLISIITATYNSEQFLQNAFDSFIYQTEENKELIVIDGNSKDNTLSIIQKNSNHIAYYQSEKDKGIYDALNKGIEKANGDIIGILHSDDFFSNKNVLKEIKNLFEKDTKLEAVYGDLQYVDRENPEKIIRNWVSGGYKKRNFKQGWMPPHPTLFIKKECFLKYGFYDLNYHSAADYDLMLRFLFKNAIRTAYLPEVLVKMRVGGLSNKTLANRWRANKEDRIAMRENGILFPIGVAVLKPLRKLNQYWNKKS